MKEVLLHTQKAIDLLRRGNEFSETIFPLERVQGSLMGRIFGASAWSASDWTLGPDEPRPAANYGTIVMNDPPTNMD